jgi:hypothetical protein
MFDPPTGSVLFTGPTSSAPRWLSSESNEHTATPILHQRVEMFNLPIIQSLFPSGLRAETPEAASWRCFFEERVDLATTVRGLSRSEAEHAGYAHVLITFLNKTYPDSSSQACIHCGQPETPAAPLLPFGVGERHAWLHQCCLDPWAGVRRKAAIEALAAMGILVPKA